MTSQNKIAWLDRGIAITSIIIGGIGILQAFDISFPPIRSYILLISTIILLIALVMKRLKRRKTVESSSTNFTAQLGNPKNVGLLPKEQRLAKLKKKQNPYVCGSSLPGNSAVFYGRGREFGGTLAVLGSPDKPGSVSILGERRIGKSSLLNQLKQALNAVPNVVTIHTTIQNWSIDSQAAFFKQLHQAICEVLKVKPEEIDDYTGFRDFIRGYAEQGYRFVLMIDEFDKMTNNTHFNAEFFGNMRALGDMSDYKFAYVLASYAPLADICHQGGIQESKFWNIFGTIYTLGLLAKKEAEQLVQEPMYQTLKQDFTDTQAVLTYAGYHPAFIQIVASEYWNASYFSFEPNIDAVQQILRDHYQEMWEHQSQAECELLRKVAKRKISTNNAILMNLKQRGLIGADNRLFTRFFRQVFESK